MNICVYFAHFLFLLLSVDKEVADIEHSSKEVSTKLLFSVLFSTSFVFICQVLTCMTEETNFEIPQS